MISSMVNQECGARWAGRRLHFCGAAFNINPNINFWIASVSAVILTAIIMSVKIEMTDHEKNRADSVRLKDVGRLFLLRDFWFL